MEKGTFYDIFDSMMILRSFMFITIHVTDWSNVGKV